MTESSFEHQRHKPPTELTRSRGMIIACAPMRSGVNLARIVRTAGCMGLERIITTGNTRIDRKIARDAADTINIETHRSLAPVLKQKKHDGYQIVGLEQTTNSESLFEFEFSYKSLLVVGNERSGLTPEILQQLDRTVEIPVYGMPYSLNAATATSMAIYEYCRQFPEG